MEQAYVQPLALSLTQPINDTAASGLSIERVWLLLGSVWADTGKWVDGAVWID
jgi:hypothetical protein